MGQVARDDAVHYLAAVGAVEALAGLHSDWVTYVADPYTVAAGVGDLAKVAAVLPALADRVGGVEQAMAIGSAYRLFRSGFAPGDGTDTDREFDRADALLGLGGSWAVLGLDVNRCQSDLLSHVGTAGEPTLEEYLAGWAPMTGTGAVAGLVWGDWVTPAEAAVPWQVVRLRDIRPGDVVWMPYRKYRGRGWAEVVRVEPDDAVKGDDWLEFHGPEGHLFGGEVGTEWGILPGQVVRPGGDVPAGTPFGIPGHLPMVPQAGGVKPWCTCGYRAGLAGPIVGEHIAAVAARFGIPQRAPGSLR